MKRVLVSNGNPMEAVVGFCRAVRVGPYISVGGTAPVDSEGNTVGIGDPAAQARKCLEIIKDALENAGAGMEDVVRTRVMLTNIDDWRKVIEVRAEYFKDIRPVDTIMQVSRFVNPQWLVEFEVDAVVSDGSTPETVGKRLKQDL
jgi:enamine deaminase RidA (YjgF/YER057c/UK114 family)